MGKIVESDFFAKLKTVVQVAIIIFLFLGCSKEPDSSNHKVLDPKEQAIKLLTFLKNFDFDEYLDLSVGYKETMMDIEHNFPKTLWDEKKADFRKKWGYTRENDELYDFVHPIFPCDFEVIEIRKEANSFRDKSKYFAKIDDEIYRVFVCIKWKDSQKSPWYPFIPWEINKKSMELSTLALKAGRPELLMEHWSKMNSRRKLNSIIIELKIGSKTGLLYNHFFVEGSEKYWDKIDNQ
jgi:hypothetical protein